EIAYRTWAPAGPAKAVVLIAHGASEHSGRYGRFAEFLAGRGYAVYALDHRGHGATARATGVGRGGPRGWDGIVDDVAELAALAGREQGERPLVLFGHSMGSFVAQLFAQRHGAQLAGLVLSGSSGAMEGLSDAVAALDAMVAGGAGDEPAAVFGAFNAPFEPARTPYDWLSRDPAEVDKYVADPMCGDDAPLTIGFVLDMLRHLGQAWDPAAEAEIPTALPVLLITGEADPVSQGGTTVRELEARYRGDGIKDVTALYYPEARHELLNETNRDQVQEDVATWLDRIV
ncbi:MAG TPA: alpha/beta hydrolase, partial [Acidimicrobiales bacterium]|nr:alpha/beta hydrolase [Acidimicrobiales bacterium]